MGIHGIYQEIGKGERISLLKYAVQTYDREKRPLRIAIDISIWLFQIQSSKGGTNPALRTFYYRLLRLISHAIHPVFVFDGPNKPPFKRNKRTGPNVASVPEFLAKQLLKMFGFPIHIAPGEAEAECALLQREGIVDAVLTEDIDALMFGSGITLRSWSPEHSSSKVPTHVNLYDAELIRAGPSGLDREGMILVALMSGGDYIPEGIPRCGPKTACEAARAGFGRDLCRIPRSDEMGFKAWRTRLNHELHTNESKLFKRKHTTLVVPEDFPRRDIMGYYTHPAISSPEVIIKLKTSLRYDHEVDFKALREFARDAFAWVNLEGAKHFIRSLAPAMLVRELRLRSERIGSRRDNQESLHKEESALVQTLHNERKHGTTDLTPEIRIGFTPLDIVKIDIGAEDPDDIRIEINSEAEEDMPPPGGNVDETSAPKKRGPTSYDPAAISKVWVAEIFVRSGVPSKVQQWEEARCKGPEGVRIRQTTNDKSNSTINRMGKKSGGMRGGELDIFTKQTKPGVNKPLAVSKASNLNSQASATPICAPPSTDSEPPTISLLSSPPATPKKSKQITLDRFMSPESSAKQINALLIDRTTADADAKSNFTAPQPRKKGGFRRIQTLPTRLDSQPSKPSSLTSIGGRRSCSPDPDLPSPDLFGHKRSKPSPPEAIGPGHQQPLQILNLCSGEDANPTQADGYSAEQAAPWLGFPDQNSSSQSKAVQPRIRSSQIVPVISLVTSVKERSGVPKTSSRGGGVSTQDRMRQSDTNGTTKIVSDHLGLHQLTQAKTFRTSRDVPPEPSCLESIDITCIDPSYGTRITKQAQHCWIEGGRGVLSWEPEKTFDTSDGKCSERPFLRLREDLTGHFKWTDGNSPEAIRWKKKNHLLQDVRVVDLIDHASLAADDSYDTARDGSRHQSDSPKVELETSEDVRESEDVVMANHQAECGVESPIGRDTRRSKRVGQKSSRALQMLDLTG